MRVLLVEDATDFADAIIERLRHDGHLVDWLDNGQSAINVLSYQSYQLLILDLGLPYCDGHSVLRYVRKQHNTMPILVLTARSGIDDRIKTLDMGADDYIVKPIDLRELSARCRALIRRNTGEVASSVAYGNVRFDRAKAQVTVEGKVLELPKRELDVLNLLLSQQGRVLSKAHIADQLSSFNDLDDMPSDNAIELYIARLRKKLHHSSVSIKTLRGIGYMAYIDEA